MEVRRNRGTHSIGLGQINVARSARLLCGISFSIELRFYLLKLDMFRNVWLNVFARDFPRALEFR
jgi:hypothetical protein